MSLQRLYQDISRFPYQGSYKNIEEEWGLEWQGQGQYPFSFCLKDRISKQRLTTLEMGKKCKQMLEHKASQSPCLLPMVCLYQCLALPVKENAKGFHHKVSSDMPIMRKYA
jgi:hypothetical protein